MADRVQVDSAVAPTVNKSQDEPVNTEALVRNPTCNSSLSENSMFGIRQSQVCSPQSTSARSTILRPSQLGTSLGGAPKALSFTLNPSRLGTFGSRSTEQPKCTTSAPALNGAAMPTFIPLLQATPSKAETSTKSSPASESAPSSFVFGQNLQARVVSTPSSSDEVSQECVATNGTSNMLFSEAMKGASEVAGSSSGQRKTLSEAAKEYEESRPVKRKYDEVVVTTGEEGEHNVLQTTCKLFAYDKAAGGSWQERGRGTLRLNDQVTGDSNNSDEVQHSRIVFRTAGSFRVVLNSKIWPDMTIQQASSKSIRLTAMDGNGEVKVFLVTGNPEEMKHLYRQLEVRITKAMQQHTVKKLATDK